MFYLVDVTGISLVESKLSKRLFLSNQSVYCNELEVIHYAFGQKLVIINIALIFMVLSTYVINLELLLFLISVIEICSWKFNINSVTCDHF